mmetsp:Transcript_2922/g.8198  ORF Transcript_2922/g.8198 Transcript_2922/m.8198 type:complete len:204 (-) Transcript_2922:1541-2152(-)
MVDGHEHQSVILQSNHGTAGISSSFGLLLLAVLPQACTDAIAQLVSIVLAMTGGTTAVDGKWDEALRGLLDAIVRKPVRRFADLVLQQTFEHRLFQQGFQAGRLLSQRSRCGCVDCWCSSSSAGNLLLKDQIIAVSEIGLQCFVVHDHLQNVQIKVASNVGCQRERRSSLRTQQAQLVGHSFHHSIGQFKECWCGIVATKRLG